MQFDKAAIKSRLSLYSALAKAIWDTSKIKELAGGWDDALEIKVQSGSGKRYTVEYGGDRSWEDAERFGFVSADSASLGNINKGDFVFCHIKGAGFVGVGVCVGSAVPGTDFLFFVVGVVRTCGSFTDVKKPEHALKLFIRFAIAKGVITYGL